MQNSSTTASLSFATQSRPSLPSAFQLLFASSRAPFEKYISLVRNSRNRHFDRPRISDLANAASPSAAYVSLDNSRFVYRRRSHIPVPVPPQDGLAAKSAIQTKPAVWVVNREKRRLSILGGQDMAQEARRELRPRSRNGLKVAKTETRRGTSARREGMVRTRTMQRIVQLQEAMKRSVTPSTAKLNKSAMKVTTVPEQMARIKALLRRTAAKIPRPRPDTLTAPSTRQKQSQRKLVVNLQPLLDRQQQPAREDSDSATNDTFRVVMSPVYYHYGSADRKVLGEDSGVGNKATRKVAEIIQETKEKPRVITRARTKRPDENARRAV